MHIFDQHHDRTLDDEPVEELDPRVVQALSRNERMQLFLDGEAEGETEQRTVSEPFGDGLGRVALEDPEVLLQHFAERPVCDALTV